MKRAWFGVAFTLVGWCIVGCAGAYKEPPSDAAAVVLCAQSGATIVTIDGQKVASGDTVNTAEQRVRAASGTHDIGLYTNSPDGSGEWTVPLALESTHTYAFAPKSATAVSLRVMDQSAGNAGTVPLAKVKTLPAIDPGRSVIRCDFSPGVLSVDENALDRPAITFPLIPSELQSIIVPGEHLVIAEGSYGNGGWARWQFRFLFERGHSYQFHQSMNKLRVTDDQSGMKVELQH